MEKDLKNTILFDVYGKLLTEKQKEVFKMYYLEDLSLGEIAEMLNISRQSVRDFLIASEKTLCNLEESINYLEKSNQIIDICKKAIIDINCDNVNKECFQSIINILEE